MITIANKTMNTNETDVDLHVLNIKLANEAETKALEVSASFLIKYLCKM